MASVAIIALSGSIGIELLGGMVREANEVTVQLGQMTALVNRQSALEWEAVANRELQEDLSSDIAANDAALASVAEELALAAGDDTELDHLVVLIGRYRAVVATEIASLRNGEFDRAAAIDEELVDPLFNTIHEHAARLLTAQAANATLISTLARLGTIGLFAGAALTVMLLARFAARREEEGRSEAKFRSLIQHSSDLITIIRGDGTIMYESASIEGLLGYPSDRAVGLSYASLVHPDDLAQLDHLIGGASEADGLMGGTEVIRLRHSDGTWRPFETVAQNLERDPDIAGIVLTARDSTERERLSERVRHQAAYDELTGLPNRSAFIDAVETGLARLGPLAVLFVDLDNFKDLNDNHGHLIGDRVLALLADRVRLAIRPGDLVARLGGDEFGILLTGPGADATGPQAVADRVLAAIRPPITVDAASCRVSASIGIAVGRLGCHAADLLGEADLAMYAAQRAGKGHYAVFEPSLQAASRERLDLHHDLDGATERGELVVHYQPIVALPTREINGVEALVRWVHPTRGLIPPTAFIPLAEESGLISVIGEWVLREATAAAIAWRRTPAGRGLGVSVNVTVRQLGDPEFAELVSAVLAEVDLPAGALTLELTESAFADPTPALSANLDALHAMGVRIAMDDFGTGYSNLGYMSRLPIDILKIDRIFVSSADDSGANPALPAAIIQVAAALGLRTVAEGIETEAQLDRMRDLGCNMGQGYLFSRPVPAGAFSALLAKKGRAPSRGGREPGREHVMLLPRARSLRSPSRPSAG